MDRSRRQVGHQAHREDLRGPSPGNEVGSDLAGARAGFVPRDRADVGGPVPWGTGELPPGWTMPPVRDDDEDIEEEPFDPNKPPEPPDTLDRFEWQRVIGKLTEMGTEVCGVPP